jgi:hypothetical protein
MKLPFPPRSIRVLLACLSLGSGVAAGAPYISEFVASNVTGLKDEDGDESDWIEIHNPDASPVDLEGWSLTDSAALEEPWIFPAVTLAPGARLVVFASGKDRRNPAANLHTDFSLAATGEYLGLLTPAGVAASEFNPFPPQLPDVPYGLAAGLETLVDRTHPLSYHVPTANIGTDWRTLAYTNPAGHFISTSGGQPLYPGIGYDTKDDYDPLIGTFVPSGTLNAYLRIPFEVADPAQLTGLTLEVQYDDAFVAWINGVEVARSSGAPASPQWNSNSSANHTALLDVPEIFDASDDLGVLQPGANVLAIQVMNTGTGSSDLLCLPRLKAASASTGIGYLERDTPGAANAAGFTPGPSISNVVHTPTVPAAGQAIQVSATVAPRFAPVTAVTLHYRVMYGAEIALPMTDSGGVHTATIPGSAFAAGQMVRWRVTAEDAAGNTWREPTFLDREGTNQSAEYFGTVALQPGIPGELPVYHWFTQNVTNARNRTGARASFFHEGAFHDNIFVRQRGGFTNTASQKFDFNQNEAFEVDPSMPKVGEVNLNAQGSDSTYLRQPVSFELLRQAGCPSSLAFPVQLRVNGAYDRVAIHIEQVDEDFLKRQALPEGGALYKFVQRANLRPVLNDIDTGVEKKTRETEDFSDLLALIAGLKQSQAGTPIENTGSLIHGGADTAARELFLFDHLNVPQVVNYLAGQVLIQDTDDTRKNFYLYRDTLGTGEWSIFPWDKDFTFGVGEAADSGAKHPFWGDAAHKNPNSLQWSVLFDAVHNSPRMRAMILRRVRTLMDEYYTPSAATGWFEAEAARLEALIDPVLNINGAPLLSEFNERRQDLYVNLFGPGSPEPLVPAAQPAGLSPVIAAVDPTPASGNQDEEFIRIDNPESTDLDISGWFLAGAVDFAFPGGTVIPAGSSVFATPAPAAFRARAVAPTGGQGHLVAGPYEGNLSSFGETVELRDASGSLRSSFTYEGAPSDVQLHLTVAEIHYNPAGDPLAEFVELVNASASVTLDLTGVSFSAGVDFDFTGAAITTLAPGERVLVVRDLAAFTAAYGSSAAARAAGVFANLTALSNGGERLKLDDATGSTVFDLTYSDLAPWPAAADGGGPSLVRIDLQAAADDPANWTAGRVGGTPGSAESTPFEDWLAGYPSLTQPADRLPAADPDGDGLDNAGEFAFALDPTDPSSAQPVTVLLDRTTATFTYTRTDPATNGLTYRVWVSPDLSTWTEDVAAEESVVDLGGGVQSVTVTLGQPVPLAAETLFVRVSAE